jgi:hypothetical protein
MALTYLAAGGLTGPGAGARPAHEPAVAQSRVFLVFAVLMVSLIPLILLVPDHHGQW